MINKLIAYDVAEVEKITVLKEVKNLYKSKVITLEQWQQINKEFATKLYSPSIFIRVLFFIVALIGLSTISGPIGMLLSISGTANFQVLSLFLGVAILVANEWVFIKTNKHYFSGVTEAGIYSSLSFIAFGLLAGNINNMLIYPIAGLILAAFAAVRYLNLVALVASLFFSG